MSKPHFVLVHGAYHTPWHLSFLASALQKAGYTTTSLSLPTTGPAASNFPTGGLAADISAIKSGLETAASEHDLLVPVFHSYGGVCGSEAVAELSESTKQKIVRIIYLAALIVPPGHALTTHSGGKLAPWGRSTDDGKIAYVPDPIPCFYHDVPADRAKEAAEKCVQHATSCFHEETKHGGWKFFPRTYVFCKDDRAVAVEVQRLFFEGMSKEEREGWEFEEMDASHSPFLSKPGETAALILKAVGERQR